MACYCLTADDRQIEFGWAETIDVEIRCGGGSDGAPHVILQFGRKEECAWPATAVDCGTPADG